MSGEHTKNIANTRKVGENEVFEQWKGASGEEKRELELRLIKLLYNHAKAICYKKLSSYRPDIINECIAIVLEKPEAFHGESLFSTWFQGMVSIKCYDALREMIKCRRRDAPVEMAEEVSRRDEGKLDAKLLVEKMMEGVAGEDREILRMKYEGYSLEEIGEALSMPSRTLDRRWNALVERLREKYGGV